MAHYFLSCCAIYSLNWEPLWSFLTAIATGGLVWVGYTQLKKFNETNKQATEISRLEFQYKQEEFLNNLKKEFFTKEARELLILIEDEALIFEKLEDHVGAFQVKIDQSRTPYLEGALDVNRKYYTTHEVDDFLLSPLEDVGLLLEKKLIDVRDVTQNFEYYLSAIFSYTPIKDYIKWAREEAEDDDIYGKAEWACDEVHKFDALDKALKKKRQS